MQADLLRKTSGYLLTAAILACLLQILWFGSKCFNQIDSDGMAYTGIARHLHEGDFWGSVNAFRSPLISWLIASLSLIYPDYLHIGKLTNVASFLLSAFLLYVFTNRLWNSRLAASVALLLFVMARGYAAAAVGFVVPDFLFALLVLLYFLFLLRCLRLGRLVDWFYLGGIHGIAFLSKAFALPWLSVCTLLAVVVSGLPLKARASRLALAAVVPVLVAGSWAIVLHSKYGKFTTGTQFKVNLLQWTLRSFRDHKETTYTVLTDTSGQVDRYAVGDPMPPGSWPWSYRIDLPQTLPKVVAAELRIVPQVMRELVIVATPGGILAFVATLLIVAGRRQSYPVEGRVVMVIAVGALSLVTAYSMLVFDARYLFPLLPLLLAVASRFLVPSSEWNHHGWRGVCVALVVVGVIASVVYRSSPFRVITRDFQMVCYDAGHLLRERAGTNIVSIGSGPFPEHGVGWEAGYKSAYFGDRRIIGVMESLPDITQLDALTMDLQKASPGALLVWGRPGQNRYDVLMRSLALDYPGVKRTKIVDPSLGEVGWIFFTSPAK